MTKAFHFKLVRRIKDAMVIKQKTGKNGSSPFYHHGTGITTVFTNQQEHRFITYFRNMTMTVRRMPKCNPPKGRRQEYPLLSWKISVRPVKV